MVRTDSASLSELAAEAFHPTTSEARRDGLIRELLAPLGVRARGYSRGDTDLADELVQHVLFQAVRGRYDPSRGSFAAWTRAVMRRYRASFFRSRLLAAGGDDPHPERADAGSDHLAPDLHIDLTTPFGTPDLVRVRRWSPRRRVVLLGWYLLWRKVPGALWSATLVAARLAVPFPDSGFEELPGSDRARHLAAALGVRRNTIVQALVRGREEVGGLRFVRELAGQ